MAARQDDYVSTGPPGLGCKLREAVVAACDPHLAEASEVELCSPLEQSEVCSVRATADEELCVAPRRAHGQSPPGVAREDHPVTGLGSKFGAQSGGEFPDVCGVQIPRTGPGEVLDVDDEKSSGCGFECDGLLHGCEDREADLECPDQR